MIILAVLSGSRTIAEWAAIVTVSVGIATGLAIVVEGIGRVVLLIPSTIRRIRREGIQEGVQQERKRSNAQWRAWLQRKQEAEAAGLPFTEPPPDEGDSLGA